MDKSEYTEARSGFQQMLDTMPSYHANEKEKARWLECWWPGVTQAIRLADALERDPGESVLLAGSSEIRSQFQGQLKYPTENETVNSAIRQTNIRTKNALKAMIEKLKEEVNERTD